MTTPVEPAPETVFFSDTPFSQLTLRGLMSPIAAQRIVPPNTKAGTKAHLEGYDLRVHMIRMFGYAGWSGEVVDTTLLYEDQYVREAGEYFDSKTQTRKPVPASDRVDVGYRVRYQLTVYVWREGPRGLERFPVAVYTEEATGDAPAFPKTKRADGHDFAVKTAATQAFKRCVMNLGDQFGLSLYSRSPGDRVVGWTTTGRHVAERQVTPPVEDLIARTAKVMAEATSDVPEEELDWVLAAETKAGDVAELHALFNEARVARASSVTLMAIKRFAMLTPEDTTWDGLDV